MGSLGSRRSAPNPGDVARALVYLAALAVLVAGCSLVRGQWGSPPRVDRLAILRPGVSTRADVLLTLGEPRGYGAMRSVVLPEAREVWYYEYVEWGVLGASSFDPSTLMVLFKGDRYDGHMWFSTNRLMKKE